MVSHQVPQITNALSVVKIDPPVVNDQSAENLRSDAMSLFVRKFGKFMRRNQGQFQRHHITRKSQNMTQMRVITVAR